MKIGEIGRFIARRLEWLILAGFCVQLAAAKTPVELTFDLLRIGTQTFTNVTVTTRNDNYVFLVHKGGMINIKVAELPDDVREKLGYDVESKRGNGKVTVWAKEKMAKLESADVKKLEAKWRERLGTLRANPAAWFTPKLIAIAASVFLLLFLFCSYCASLICRKTGNEPGILVWLPFVQLVPLLRAAGLPPIWVVAWLVPALNVVAQVVWSVKIVRARGKGWVVALLLMLPITNLFAFAYLAFSNGAAAKEDAPPKLMTLEAA